ncbi:hypothetical protein AOX59_07660 [Lentibacillus amyloliquefaciens]|uniref:Uncharacterized protein n=1 Tax=Lentibacillus amyloliquefaciens TaxID=1472767 RepID=A0A0U4FIP5_9BACI|nr:hypothetical protein AOX59_07660 [Lentibacillus amyloliquefaciens]
MIGAKGSRLLRENGQLKIPQEAVFASEEAEALPAESDCPQRISILPCKFAVHTSAKQQNLRKEPILMLNCLHVTWK